MSETTKIKSLQEWADARVAPKYRQPLKTVREAVAANGWEFADKPICCGQSITTRSMFGDTHFGQCETCRLFIVDVTGPQFSETGSSVFFIDTDKFPADTDWTRSWINGKETQP